MDFKTCPLKNISAKDVVNEAASRNAGSSNMSMENIILLML